MFPLSENPPTEFDTSDRFLNQYNAKEDDHLNRQCSQPQFRNLHRKYKEENIDNTRLRNKMMPKKLNITFGSFVIDNAVIHPEVISLPSPSPTSTFETSNDDYTAEDHGKAFDSDNNGNNQRNNSKSNITTSLYNIVVMNQNLFGPVEDAGVREEKGNRDLKSNESEKTGDDDDHKNKAKAKNNATTYFQSVIKELAYIERVFGLFKSIMYVVNVDSMCSFIINLLLNVKYKDLPSSEVDKIENNYISILMREKAKIENLLTMDCTQNIPFVLIFDMTKEVEDNMMLHVKTTYNQHKKYDGYGAPNDRTSLLSFAQKNQNEKHFIEHIITKAIFKIALDLLLISSVPKLLGGVNKCCKNRLNMCFSSSYSKGNALANNFMLFVCQEKSLSRRNRIIEGYNDRYYDLIEISRIPISFFNIEDITKIMTNLSYLNNRVAVFGTRCETNKNKAWLNHSSSLSQKNNDESKEEDDDDITNVDVIYVTPTISSNSNGQKNN